MRKLTHQEVVDRFWSMVEKTDGCWYWKGYINAWGYGLLTVRRKRVLAHRFVYELVNNQSLGKLLCCHTCDTPNCVRPDHLFAGTNADNMRDMVVKGRHTAIHLNGETNPAAKLTAAQVQEIRDLYATGKYRQREIAQMYPVGQATIAYIIARKRWRAE